MSGETPAEPAVTPGPEACERAHTTGDLARLTGNTLRAVRHYEAERLVSAFGRGPRGERLFDDRQLDRLRFVTDMRALSFSIRSIRELLEAAAVGSSPAEVADRAIPLLEARIEELHERLRTLRHLRDDLVRTKETAEECRACERGWEARRCPLCEAERGGGTPSLLRLLWQRPPG